MAWILPSATQPPGLRAPPRCLLNRKPPNAWDLGSQGLAGGCSAGQRRVHIFKPDLLEAHLQVAASCHGLCTNRHPSTLQAAGTKPTFLLATISCSRNEGYWKRSDHGFARWSFKALLLSSLRISLVQL